jgi:hypothetical protein
MEWRRGRSLPWTRLHLSSTPAEQGETIEVVYLEEELLHSHKLTATSHVFLPTVKGRLRQDKALEGGTNKLRSSLNTLFVLTHLHLIKASYPVSFRDLQS